MLYLTSPRFSILQSSPSLLNYRYKARAEQGTPCGPTAIDLSLWVRQPLHSVVVQQRESTPNNNHHRTSVPIALDPKPHHEPATRLLPTCHHLLLCRFNFSDVCTVPLRCGHEEHRHWAENDGYQMRSRSSTRLFLQACDLCSRL